MKLGQLAAVAGILVARHLLSKRTISWNEVENWVHEYGNPDLSGAGFVGSSLRPSSRNSYAEVRREQSNGKVKITASILFNARQGEFANQSWSGTGLDKALKQRFGDNLRFRIRL